MILHYEMMLGIKEKFNYFQCSNCDCLQIQNIPKDLARFYPTNYYSTKPIKRFGFIESYLRKKRVAAITKRQRNINNLISQYLHLEPFYMNWLGQIELPKSAKILDVGSGSGLMLLELKNLGFTNLTGIDPFIEKDICYSKGFTLWKKDIMDLSETFDFIMFNHSFEHLQEPERVLLKTTMLLNDNGLILIRIPLVGSFAWEHYKTNWVQLDAPRHLFLHSRKSIDFLANRTALKIEEVFYDSTEFQFWGSEQYLQNIPLMDRHSYAVDHKNSIFSRKQIENYRAKAIELNATQQGDQACFFIRKSAS